MSCHVVNITTNITHYNQSGQRACINEIEAEATTAVLVVLGEGCLYTPGRQDRVSGGMVHVHVCHMSDTTSLQI